MKNIIYRGERESAAAVKQHNVCMMTLRLAVFVIYSEAREMEAERFIIYFSIAAQTRKLRNTRRT